MGKILLPLFGTSHSSAFSRQKQAREISIFESEHSWVLYLLFKPPPAYLVISLSLYDNVPLPWRAAALFIQPWVKALAWAISRTLLGA